MIYRVHVKTRRKIPLPKEVVEQCSIKNGDKVYVAALPNGVVIIMPPKLKSVDDMYVDVMTTIMDHIKKLVAND